MLTIAPPIDVPATDCQFGQVLQTNGEVCVPLSPAPGRLRR